MAAEQNKCSDLMNEYARNKSLLLFMEKKRTAENGIAAYQDSKREKPHT